LINHTYSRIACRPLLAQLLSLLLCTLGWTTAHAATTGPIRIAVMLPLNSAMSDVANSALIGAQVAVEEINSVGGYLGRLLELMVHDDQANPDIGFREAQNIIQREGAVATIGICNTSVAVRVEDYFQSNKHPLIISCATGSVIGSKTPPAQSYLFKLAISTTAQAQFLIGELQRSKSRKVAILADSSPYGDAGLRDLQTAMAKAGMKPRAVLRFNVGAKNVDREMQDLKASGADTLLAWAIGPDQGTIAAARAAANWQVPHYGGWDLSNSTAYINSNGKVEGAYMVQTVLPNRHLERNSAFMSAYAKHSREHPMGSMMAAAQTYDAVQILMRALFAVRGDFAGPAIKAALEKPDNAYRGVITTYDQPFSDTDHEALTPSMLWLGTWHNGEREYAHEEDEKRAAIIRYKGR